MNSIKIVFATRNKGKLKEIRTLLAQGPSNPKNEGIYGRIGRLKKLWVSATITLYAIRDLTGAERREILSIKELI
ncbi:hypothetical protein HY623_03090 [Candidatus Uhrbacteria bacterium]|nr:hypothetical protein [Candidatus Uhrbacteria bacterium]